MSCKISRTKSTKGDRCIARFDVLLGIHYLNAQQNHQESREEVGGKRNLRFNKVELKKKVLISLLIVNLNQSQQQHWQL